VRDEDNLGACSNVQTPPRLTPVDTTPFQLPSPLLLSLLLLVPPWVSWSRLHPVLLCLQAGRVGGVVEPQHQHVQQCGAGS